MNLSACLLAFKIGVEERTVFVTQDASGQNNFDMSYLFMECHFEMLENVLNTSH